MRKILLVLAVAIGGCAVRGPSVKRTYACNAGGHCTARAGHVDVATRWVSGQSLEQIATELGLGSEREARHRVIRALKWMREQVSDGSVLPASLAEREVLLAGNPCQAGKSCQP